MTGGDVNDELLKVRDTVSQVTGSPARTFHLWVSENAAAFLSAPSSALAEPPGDGLQQFVQCRLAGPSLRSGQPYPAR